MTEDQTSETANTEQEVSEQPLKWTVMIYLAGDNSLSANSIAIMQALEDANHHKNVRVLACFDSNTPRPKGARYLEIKHRRYQHGDKPPMQWGLHNDLVPPEERERHSFVAPDFCNRNPSSSKLPDEPVAKEGLSRFLKFALKKHRADRYVLIIFGHGPAVAGNTFLADSNPPSFLRLKDFTEVLARHFGDGKTKSDDDKTGSGEAKPRLDILACDNCVMSGIEVAYEVRNMVDYMIGSEGLMLTVAWPYRKIINAVARAVEHDPRVSTETVANKILRACARSLLDFSLMERSSEQSLCDLTKLRDQKTLVSAVKGLSAELKMGLAYDATGKVVYPAIRDAVRLARLEAQSYWDETFVDLYDFCQLLLQQCNQAVGQPVKMLFNLQELVLTKLVDNGHPTEKRFNEPELKDLLLNSKNIQQFKKIAARCKEVLEEIKAEKAKKFVLSSYYVGPDLQYSNGISIYFPWTLPESPLLFDPVYDRGAVSTQGRPDQPFEPINYILRPPFEEYKLYAFAQPGGGDWAAFLESFFRATLRNVRRFEYEYVEDTAGPSFFKFDRRAEASTLVMEAHKTGSDVGIESSGPCSMIKNYPRRYYVSPADCRRRCDITPQVDKDPCVSYLGWNIRGLVAKLIRLRTRRESSEPLNAVSTSSEQPTGETLDS